MSSAAPELNSHLMDAVRDAVAPHLEGADDIALSCLALAVLREIALAGYVIVREAPTDRMH